MQAYDHPRTAPRAPMGRQAPGIVHSTTYLSHDQTTLHGDFSRESTIQPSREMSRESPKSKTTPPEKSRPILRFWTLEVVSLLLAAGFMIAIWVIIAKYHGKPLPDWSLPVNLSTLVSILSVGYRMTVVSPLSTIMGQEKWPWLARKPRPLIDVSRIEFASNGLIGSIKLLILGPRSPVAMLGSVILLLAIAVGPAAQQALQTVECKQPVPDVIASIPVANYKSGHRILAPNMISIDNIELHPNAKGALINGLINPQGNDTVVAATCPTGECDFPNYASIGLCHSCIDTSSMLVDEGFDWGTNYSFASHQPKGKYTFPGGENMTLDYLKWLAAGPTNMSALDTSLFTPEYSHAIANSISNFTIMAMTSAPCGESPGYTACKPARWSSGRALAVSCSLHPCVRKFNGTVTKGQLHEKLLSKAQMFRNRTATDDINVILSPNYTAVDVPCRIQDKLYDFSNFSTLDKTKYSFVDVPLNGTPVSVPYECAYILDGYYANGVSSYVGGYNIGDTFSFGHMFKTSCQTYIKPNPPICGDAFWIEKFYSKGLANLTSISDIVDQFVTAVSSDFRKTGSTLYPGLTRNVTDGEGGIRQPVVGTAYKSTLCVNFVWYWLIWPLILFVVTLASLVLTVLRTFMNRDQPIWKSNPLPLLYHRMEEPVPVAEMMNEKQLSAHAKQTKVEFVKQGAGGLVRLVD